MGWRVQYDRLIYASYMCHGRLICAIRLIYFCALAVLFSGHREDERGGDAGELCGAGGAEAHARLDSATWLSYMYLDCLICAIRRSYICALTVLYVPYDCLKYVP